MSSPHVALLLLIGFGICLGAQPEVTSKAEASARDGKFTLSNAAIASSFDATGGHLRQLTITNQFAHRTLPAPEDVFQLIVSESSPIRASQMNLLAGPRMVVIPGEPHSARLAGRLPGQSVEATLRDDTRKVTVTWRAILLDGSNYVRQEIAIHADSGDVPISSVRLIDWNLPDATVAGAVKGSPIVSHDMFFGFEHPLSESTVSRARAIASLGRELPLKQGQTVNYSSVIGVARPTQLRRAFLTYLERERAHPYRTFLQYNTWYDLGYFNRYDEAGALREINAFGTELV